MSDNPYQTPEVPEVSSGPALGSQAERIRKEHLATEASLRGMGLLFLVGAVLLLFALISILTSGVQPGGVEVLYLFLIMVVQAAAWWGLRRLKPWAKVPAGILSAFGLLGFPVGTIVGAYFLFLLFGKRGRMVLSPGYQEIIEQTPGLKYRTPVWNWIVLAVLLLILIGIVVLAMFAG